MQGCCRSAGPRGPWRVRPRRPGRAARLIESLVTTAEPRDRGAEAERAKARAALRFGNSPA